MTTKLRHTRDNRMGITAGQAIWHADKRMEVLVADIFEKLSPFAFIETGTHMGWTAHWVASRYPGTTVYTTEIDPEYYRLSGENLEGLPNVRHSLGDSRLFLRMIASVPLPVVFWLDAHFHADHPLREECEIVSRYKGPHVVLIDDYHCGADFPGDTAAVPWVESTLGKDYWRPNYAYEKGFSGYALFVRGVQYEPPKTMRKAR
jgi:hypothetical protein